MMKRSVVFIAALVYVTQVLVFPVWHFAEAAREDRERDAASCHQRHDDVLALCDTSCSKPEHHHHSHQPVPPHQCSWCFYSSTLQLPAVEIAVSMTVPEIVYPSLLEHIIPSQVSPQEFASRAPPRG